MGLALVPAAASVCMYAPDCSFWVGTVVRWHLVLMLLLVALVGGKAVHSVAKVVRSRCWFTIKHVLEHAQTQAKLSNAY